MPKVRKDAVARVKIDHWSIRKTARYYGVQPSTVSRWCKKDQWGGRYDIPTKSPRPKRSPKALPRKIVETIIEERTTQGRCAEHVHKALVRQGVKVSLSSVKRTLDRCHLTKKRSVWKRPHDNTKRPEVTHSGALVWKEIVRIHTH